MKRNRIYEQARRKLKENGSTEVCAYLSAPEALTLMDSGWVCTHMSPWYYDKLVERVKVGNGMRVWIYFKKPKGFQPYA